MDNAYQYKGKIFTCMNKFSNVVSKLRQEANLQHAVMIANVPESQSGAIGVHGEW